MKVSGLTYDVLNGIEEILQGDIGATLVIQKSLFVSKNDLGNNWLHTNLFHSICTIKDNVCNMIIELIVVRM